MGRKTILSLGAFVIALLAAGVSYWIMSGNAPPGSPRSYSEAIHAR
jgi:hypothetical protein